ncbi:hypothetical protein EFT36_15575 [Raoultella ornithinolytica]|nr:hypothetical protein EFT36_15575 [Raoultella ornithinolytica]OWY89801.1 hypothetical protein CAC00_00375 [Raoultella ornithinolytica]HCJ05369.1 hypothetical protein [Raoultella ornithinolytica]
MRYSFIADKKVQGCIAPAMVSGPDTGRDRNSGMREALAVLRPGDSFYAEGIACPYYAVAACVPDLFAPPLRVNVLPLPGIVAVR